jgi:hypothetical protein
MTSSVHPNIKSTFYYFKFNFMIDRSEWFIAISLNVIIKPYIVLTELGLSKNLSYSKLIKSLTKFCKESLITHHLLLA